MTYILDFFISGLPPTTNGSHGHWAVAAAERKKWRDAVRMIAHSRRPAYPLRKAKVTITRCSSRPTDFDNRVIAAKPILDGLIDAKVLINDTDEVIVERHYPYEKAKERRGCVKIRIEEVA